MLDELNLQDDDRLLLLWIPEPQEVERLSRRLSRGLLVAQGSEDEVWNARRACAHLDNVMFVPESGGEIPWRDGMFTMAVGVATVTPELLRVVVPGGPIHLRV